CVVVQLSEEGLQMLVQAACSAVLRLGESPFQTFVQLRVSSFEFFADSLAPGGLDGCERGGYLMLYFGGSCLKGLALCVDGFRRGLQRTRHGFRSSGDLHFGVFRLRF